MRNSSRLWIGLRKPTSCSSRRPSDRRLPLQARTDPGRRLREPAQEPPSGASPPGGRGVARPRRPRPKRSPIISPRPVSTISPSNGGARPATRPPPLGLPGGDRPSRQGDRHGGQGGRSLRRRARVIRRKTAAQVGRPTPAWRVDVVEGIRRGGSKARRTAFTDTDNGFNGAHAEHWPPIRAVGPPTSCAARWRQRGRRAENFLRKAAARGPLGWPLASQLGRDNLLVQGLGEASAIWIGA